MKIIKITAMTLMSIVIAYGLNAYVFNEVDPMLWEHIETRAFFVVFTVGAFLFIDHVVNGKGKENKTE